MLNLFDSLHYVGIELNPEYVAIAADRLKGEYDAITSVGVA